MQNLLITISLLCLTLTVAMAFSRNESELLDDKQFKPISKIRSISVNVSDHEKAYDFYVNKLGFEVSSDQVTEEGYFWLVVAPAGSETPIALAPPPPEKEVGGFTNIVFASDNIENSYQIMRAKGVAFTQKPEKQDWGGILALFSDPDGNIFALVEAQD